MTSLRDIALGAFAAWITIDGIVVFRHKTGKTENRDRRSLKLIVIASPTVLWIAIGLSFSRAGSIHRPAVQAAALAVMAIGIAVRSVAIAQLGRFHTPNVAVRADHRLRETGLYRVVRHPSYLGALIAFLGFSLALGNWLSAIVVTGTMPWIYLYRIREEDAALAAAFGDSFRDYCRRTKRLIPGVY